MIFNGQIDDQEQLRSLAMDFAQCLNPGQVVYTQGLLGAGKTTFIRAVLRHLGVSGRVKSPSYTLIETYEVGGLNLYHMDLYRCSSQLEIIELGLEDYFTKDAIVFVEWPEKAHGLLPKADYELFIRNIDDGNSRWVKLTSYAKMGPD